MTQVDVGVPVGRGLRAQRALAVLLAAAVVVASCSSSDDSDAAPGVAPSSGDETSSSIVGDPDDQSRRGPVEGSEASAVLPTGDPAPVTIIAVDIEETPGGFSAAGPAFEVTANEDFAPHRAELRLPGTPPPEGTTPVVLHLNHRGDWEALPATYLDEGVYLTRTATFSPFIPGFISDATEWVTNAAADVVEAAGRLSFVDSISDWITGRTDPPDPCGREAYGWVADTGAPPDGAFHVCIKANPTDDGAERVEVELKSNRNFAMWVVVPDNEADYVWVEGADWGLLGPIINSFVPGSGNRVLLPPGARMTVGYRQPPAVSVNHTFFAYQDNWSIGATAIIDQLGSAGLIGVTLSALACAGTDTSTVDRIAGCVTIAGDIADEELDRIIRQAVSDGRIALDSGDTDGFIGQYLEVFRADSLRDRLRQIGRGLFWADLARKWATAANDAATGNADLAGTYFLTLVASTLEPPADTPSLDSCEGLDTAPALVTAVSIVYSVCSWPWALVSFTEPQPRLSVSVLYQDGYPAEQLVYFTGVEEGAQISGYTPEAIVEYSRMPLQTARLLYEALGGADAGHSTPPPPPPQLYPAAACVAGSLIYDGSGPNAETALYQQLLGEFGYDPGPADGYFGENTWLAAINEINDNGNINGSNGIFDEYYPDEGVILPGVFERLGIAC